MMIFLIRSLGWFELIILSFIRKYLGGIVRHCLSC